MGPLFTLEPQPGAPSRARARARSGAHRGLMALPLLLPLLLGAAGAAVPRAVPPAVPPAVPAPRELARSVLETHGQELRLLRLLGVARTSFDWGTHFSINFTARQPPCPKPGPDPRGCRGRPGRVQRCSAQVSVFTFLPDVPLSMVECGREPQPGDGAQPRFPGTSPGHSSSSSSSSSSPGPPPRPRPLPSASRRPLSPAGPQ